jgi:hypothetical protein
MQSSFLLQNVIVWDVTLCGSCKNRQFGGTFSRMERISELGSTFVVTSSLILSILMMEELCFSETLAVKRIPRRHIQ